MKKMLFTWTILMLFSPAFAQQPKWNSVCGDPAYSYCYYCNDVGKAAYTRLNNGLKVKLGVIQGVSWRPRGSIIHYSPAIPKTNISEEIRVSDADSFYYIIDDGAGKPFLMRCRYVMAK